MGAHGLSSAVGAAVAVAAFAAFVACEDDPSPGGDAHAALTECPTANPCPEETTCRARTAEPDDPCDAGSDGQPEVQACDGGACLRVVGATRGAGRNALLEAFGVPAFQLEQLVENQAPVAAFRWEPPKSARIVACALFSCLPQWHDVGDPPTRELLCYDRCVVEAKQFEPPSGVFDLRVDYTATGHALNESQLGAPLDVLLTGCWAYDASRVIAASPMVPVDPTGVYPYPGLFDLQCTGLGGGTCVLESGEFGTCISGRCGRRCMTNADCLERDRASEDAGVCHEPLQRCAAVHGHYLGACTRIDRPTADAGDAASDATGDE